MAKILVIDDDPAIVELLNLRLTEAGHDVIASMDGASGSVLASRENPDLIILDFQMPAANGATVHARLRGNTFTSDTPVIFLTGATMGNIISQVASDSRTRYLQKPIDMAALNKTIDAILHRNSPPREGKPQEGPPPVYWDSRDERPAGGEILDLD